MLHEDLAGGQSAIDVDHFDPTLKNRYLQPYDNLFPACRHCNGKKQNAWPSEELRKKGVRFLDCTKEHDYGDHILEDPETHRVFGITPAGRYHVRVLDLNADVLVKQRKLRADFQTLTTSTPVRFTKPFAQMAGIIQMGKELIKLMIPPIPYGTQLKMPVEA